MIYYIQCGLVNLEKLKLIGTVILKTWFQKMIEVNNLEIPISVIFDIIWVLFGEISRNSIIKMVFIKWMKHKILKNPQAKQRRAVKSIKSRNKIEMTGTPVENRLSYYWSIYE